MLDRIIIANSIFLDLTADIVAAALRCPITRRSLVHGLVSAWQDRQKQTLANRLCGAHVFAVKPLKKGTYRHCLLSSSDRTMGMAEVENQSAAPGVILAEEPGTAPAKDLSALPSCIIADAQTPASRHQEPNVDLRQLKALELAARARIVFTNGHWLVPSQTSPGTSYRVALDPPRCECEDFALRQQPCKHVTAARLVCERQGGQQAPAMDTSAVPKKPTYKQDWPAYGRAQKIEKRRVQELLRDLCSRLPERERHPKRRGPKPHLVSDAVFAMALKVYCGLSSRRTHTDLEIAFQKGYTSKLVPGAKVTAFFEDEYFTPVLKDLIAFSAAPLRAVEHKFAIDSSGFSSCRYEDYYDYKHGSGVPRRRCAWVKCHIASGVTTHCISAVRILDKDAGDSPQFIPLLKETRKGGFEITEVSADKAYASYDNFEEIAACGAQGYIAFKSNTTGAVGGHFEKAFHLFMASRDEYLGKYHLRSNVETTFSSVKRKFGHSVMSLTDTAMVNECLVKFLCQNLSVLVQVEEEMGLVPVFWKNEPVDDDGDERSVLAFPMAQRI